MKKDDVRKLLRLNDMIDILSVEEENNRITVFIKSMKKKVRCPRCNEFSNKIHDYLKPSRIDYLTISGLHSYLIAYKRRFECFHCNKSFTEDLELTNKNANVSIMLKKNILKDCLDRDKTLKQISYDNNVSEDIVRTTFLEAMKNYPDYLDNLPEVISFDEVSTHVGESIYSFILNDPIHKYTLDILENRNKDFLVAYFMKVKNRKSVKVVICDLYRPYYEVVKICFPNAIFVADQFHYTKYVEDGLDKIRMRLVHQYESNKNSKEYRMIKNIQNKGLLLKSFNETKYERKKREDKQKKYEKGLIKNKPKDKYNDYWYGVIRTKKNNKYVEEFRIDRLNSVLELSEDLKIGYNLKEEFLRIKDNVSYEEAEEALINWILSCKKSNIPEMIEAAKTIENWLEAIVNSFIDERYSNGFTEANNNTIDKIVDRAYGYKNFKFFRLRTLAILHQSYSTKKSKKTKKVSSKKWWKYYKNR